MAEGRFKTVLPRDHASETTVGKGAVAESRFKGGLPRDHATGMPVAGVAVSG